MWYTAFKGQMGKHRIELRRKEDRFVSVETVPEKFSLS
jgi:hypothetical protein